MGALDAESPSSHSRNASRPTGSYLRSPPGPKADGRVPYINLFAFANMPAAARAVVGAGAAGVVVDWERRGKGARQAGADTQINADTPDHLAAVRAPPVPAPCCAG